LTKTELKSSNGIFHIELEGNPFKCFEDSSRLCGEDCPCFNMEYRSIRDGGIDTVKEIFLNVNLNCQESGGNRHVFATLKIEDIPKERLVIKEIEQPKEPKKEPLFGWRERE
jgi:hypothetical protein